MHEKYGYYVYEEDVEDWGKYGLRPEVIEVSPPQTFLDRMYASQGTYEVLVSVSPCRRGKSQFYAWRTTGDPKYQERGWAAFESIERYCKLVNGSVRIPDGRRVEGGGGGGREPGMIDAVSAKSVGDVWNVTGGKELDWKTEVSRGLGSDVAPSQHRSDPVTAWGRGYAFGFASHSSSRRR
jgi:hypothetical protein